MLNKDKIMQRFILRFMYIYIYRVNYDKAVHYLKPYYLKPNTVTLIFKDFQNFFFQFKENTYFYYRKKFLE